MTRSWVPVPADSDFPVQNLPYGVFSLPGQEPRVGVAIGDFVLDVSRVGLPYASDLAARTLNPFMARGRTAWREVRETLVRLLTDEAHRSAVEPHLILRDRVRLHLPFEVADYVDFYASEHHASNVGRIFRPGQDPLTPNWKHLPIGYHGRAGTVVVSGTPVVRPCGQRKAPDAPAPVFGPSARLDIEAEVGFVVGVPSEPGTPVPVSDFAEHVFGAVLVNDWSARDVQAWEYVPLGPFLGKSFATSVSPWVVPLDALEHARTAPPAPDPQPLPYLREDEPWGLDLQLEVELNGEVVSRPPFGQMYWTAAQQLAHMTVNGAHLRTGDLYASGTVSGPEPGQRGSFLELSWGGKEPVKLADGSTRSFLEDGDTVVIRAGAPGADGVRIGFGEVAGTVAPARTGRA
ncbi:fumarylacetoacetase [Streptomyces sp. SCUT-3]|uniref:fumarylacetoacetase n=1 Tax=Streptomyces TaxID=1883 RepID=UPI000CA7E66E|nr:fumarylacetoacetase [Streptomyces sp. SCUT-3]PLW74702.1 fumarylacetoacetase [Streptomyces sp. DJ]QMV23727.1 fumarylacetoacetase [Streptomyces sp. SCUT-3]